MDRSRNLVLALVVIVACWGVGAAEVSAQQSTVLVHAYSHPLLPGDRLEDGPGGAEIGLEGETLLLWVDLMPGSYFTHPTRYILISREGVRVVDGGWWPVLNGRTILYGKQNGAVLTSPLEIGGDDGAGALVHLYPEELAPGDLLADGVDVSAVMWSHTFFAWVDLMPDAYFVHPTVFILVMANHEIIVHNGHWWPVLNGKVILHGSRGDYGVPFPFRLADH